MEGNECINGYAPPPIDVALTQSPLHIVATALPLAAFSLLARIKGSNRFNVNRLNVNRSETRIVGAFHSNAGRIIDNSSGIIDWRLD